MLHIEWGRVAYVFVSEDLFGEFEHGMEVLVFVFFLFDEIGYLFHLRICYTQFGMVGMARWRLVQ